jgi:tRNA-specific 2-thiouridylase
MIAPGLPSRLDTMRVVVAMSGGVDSSVVAALLVEQGYEVVGITLQLYDHGEATGRKGACCAGQDIHDARRVADRLGTPHYVLDYERRFRDAVMADFAESYAAGRTPIPCVLCNQRLKFRDLLDTARDLDAQALATGHYVRRIVGPSGPQLWRAADAGKDQSYFLFATTPAQLEFLRFPLGTLTKEGTRAAALRFDLPVAAKPESQDICFVPNGSYSAIVERLRPGAAEPGEIVDREGNVLGGHGGVIHFTVGQRRGLGIAASEPYYVLALDAAKRQVIVGPRCALARSSLTVSNMNWLGDAPLVDDPARVQVKIRSTSPAVPAQVAAISAGRARVVFAEPQEGVAPGQACVFYDGDRVLGGGWIEAEEVQKPASGERLTTLLSAAI